MRGIHICTGTKPSKRAVRKAVTLSIIESMQTEIALYPNEKSAVIEFAMRNAPHLLNKRYFRYAKFLRISPHLPTAPKTMLKTPWLHLLACVVVVTRNAVMSEVYADLERVYR
jgi:hypothetical protein